ncbi:MAG: helix-turn-helix transcriptional regulator [Micrococcales bacterium]|nr:helix-turn-helix transcriptional regulator [Micrococcales bacterium]
MEQDLAATVDDVVGCLRDSISVNLVGLRQSGRSRTALGVADRLRELGCDVVVVYGVAALRDRPLVALALAGVDVPSGNAVSSVSGAVDALSELMAPGRSVLVVDDADDLDPASGGVVVAARARRPFPVLSVTRPAGRRSSSLLTTRLQPGVRVVLDPLDFDGLHRVVHRMLPGLVDSSTVAQIATLSGGLLGLVEAVVDTGRRTGSIAEDDRGIWRAGGALWDGRLAQVVEPLVADLADDELDALTRLSLVGTVTAAQAQAIVPEPVFARIDKMGLLQVAETPSGPLVGVFPPLVAEHLRRTRAVCRPAVFDEADPVADAPVTPRFTLTSSRAAILNMRIVDYWRAEVNTLRAVWSADPSVENAIPLLVALNAASAGVAEFAGVIDGTRLEGSDPQRRVRFVCWHVTYRALLLDDLDGARRLLEEHRARLPAFASRLRALEAMIQFLAGLVPGPELLAPDGLGSDPLGAPGLELARITTAVVDGRTVDALAALPGYAPDYPFYLEWSRVVVGLARVLHGDFDDGVEWALRAMTEAETRLSLGEIHGHAYVAALGLAFAGRLDDLDALLGPVLTLSGTTMFSEHYRIGVLGLASLAAGWRGRLDYGWSLSVQAETTGRRPGPYPGMLHGVTPLVTDPDGRWDEAGERLWRATAERLSKGYVAAAVAVAVTAVDLLPDAERAADVVEQARRTQSSFLVRLGDYVAATVTGDPDALAACAADLWGCGARLHSVKALVTRSLVLRLRGDVDGSVQQAESAWQRASELGQPRPRGLFFRLGHAVGLSAREREIALMIANGTTVPGIASTLGLSMRTVENYLVGTYRKLACEGRDDLVRAVTTWAVLE